MRIWTLLAVICAVSNATFKDFFVSKVEENQKGEVVGLSAGEREKLMQAFSRTDMSIVQKRLKNLRNKWKKELKMDEKTKNELEHRMQKYKQKARDLVRSEGDSLHEVNLKANLTDYLYQGDIVLTIEQADVLAPEEKSNSNRTRRQAYKDRYYPSTTWGKTVYYYFDTSATSSIQSVFRTATQFWHDNTCIDFQESTTAANRIRVFKGQGCYSYIGMVRGVQELSLGSGCDSVGTAAHELGHALGFFHTQSRVDRDNYITVNINNIQPNYVDQFDKESSSTNYNYGMPYDYGSVMHYGGLSASRNKNPTMVAKDINYQDTMGSDMVGFYDISMMNEHYQCKDKCPTNNIQCANGGFLHPRSCSSCICPSGYGQPFCDQRPTGCGSVLTPSADWQTLTDSIGDGTQTMQTDFQKCNYWIQAPAGSRVEVRLKSFAGYYTDGCVYGGVEIKTHQDQKLTGYRVCSKDDAGITFVSTSNIVPIITYNRYSKSTTELEYRISDGTAPPTMAPSVTTTTAKVATNCQDRHSNCKILEYFGYCRMRNVQFECPKSCRACSRIRHG